MKNPMKTLALAAFLATLGGGAALAADQATKMDCCAKCECCKDKPADGKPAQPQPEHKH
ncbi:hypothetical protein M9M90_19660 [Phenylobacterium sp. LH3H17]|uniref:hypothetical protein n=1 Tax=Phenylobacterium sp. LH3H17 TaxID=2903901 RepID=UPI0020C97C79|nr:hypothetical protein [Phenylobacterium sp. LH3H17]UTP39399.1 hypothetical protein M9M90_19660 [Phenylobacterium sp. LH3H17]